MFYNMFSTKTPLFVLNRVNYWDVKYFVYICCEKMSEKRIGILQGRPKTNKEKLPRIRLIVYGRDNTVGDE